MKTCIITGAGLGIGRATSIALAESIDISTFILIGLGIDDLTETKTLMKEKISGSKDIVLYDQDITDTEKIGEIIENVYKKYKRIDILLNIAGYIKKSSFINTSLDLLKKTFEVNVFALFGLTQHVVRHMKKQGGVIVNVASTSGSTPRESWIAYACSKSAVIGISRTLAYELSDFGIKVFNVSPGRCATEMRKSIAPNENDEHLMKPESVADLLAFIVKNPNCNIDGQDIIIRKLVS